MAINKGNAGEWSEPYVLLRLLFEGRIYKSDENLNLIKEVWHDIDAITFREDSKDKDGSLRYEFNEDKKTVDFYKHGKLIAKIQREECGKYADGLMNSIKSSLHKSGTVDVDDSYKQYLTEKLGRVSLKASSKDTPDIWLELQDARNNTDKPLGFSIKSNISNHPPTIFNSSYGSNIVFKITGNPTSEEISAIRNLTKKGNNEKTGAEFDYSDYSARIEKFKEFGLGLEFVCAGTVKMEDGIVVLKKNNQFGRNLAMVGADIPEILGYMVAEAYFNGIMNMADLLSYLNSKDPLNYHPSKEQPFYKKRIQDLLVAMALSMKALEVWDGSEGTNGGLIIVKENGDVVCYHIFDRNDFREFLLNNLKFDYPSNSRYHSMSIFEENGEYYTTLNVQVRMGQKKGTDSKRMLKGYYNLEEGEYLFETDSLLHLPK